MSELSQKLLSRSKYYHSKNKDKNRYKKKAKYVKSNQNETTQNEPETEELPEEESDVDHSRYRRRTIETNAHRYENPEETYEDDDLSEVISLQESSHASQFRFLSEQEWEEDQTQTKSTVEITVNYETLSAALNTLPIFVKLKIEEVLLTEDIKNQKLTTRAEPNLNEFVVSHVSAPDDTHNTLSSQPNTITDKTLEDDQRALESLLNLTKQESATQIPKGQEDLEQWLESVI